MAAARHSITAAPPTSFPVSETALAAHPIPTSTDEPAACSVPRVPSVVAVGWEAAVWAWVEWAAWVAWEEEAWAVAWVVWAAWVA